MSWSVSAVGRPAAVKAALAEQFANAKRNTVSVPHEQTCVGLVEQIVNEQLDFLADVPKTAVRVDAGGSAYKSGTPTTSGNSNVKVEVQPIFGWVE